MLQGCHTRMPFSQVSRGFCCNCELLAITLANIGDNSREWMALPAESGLLAAIGISGSASVRRQNCR
jgi:hypothetical protein